jgi:hypothetical protein
MSEDSEQADQQTQTVKELSHRRILAAMTATVFLGTLLGFIFGSASFGFGFLIGGILSLINYYWLKQSLRVIFENAVSGEKPRFLATKYFTRYAAFGLVLAIVYLTKTVPVVAVLLGLASFAFAIMIEATVRLFSAFFKK